MIGNYGTKRPADVSVEDIDVILVFTPFRDFNGVPTVTKLNSVDVITPLFHNDETGGNSGIEILGGLYTLTLPADVFSQKGIYNLYIKPAEIRLRITDCGVLSISPEVKGLVFDINNVPSNFLDKFINNGLVGYRVEYLNTNGTKIQNFFKIITTSFLSEPVNQNLSDVTQKAIRYRFVDNGNLLFCTLSPTSAPSIRPNAIPFIGQPNQEVIITNTFFNPINIEIEMVEHDIETLALGLFGEQAKNVDNGIYTIYDEEGNIFKQYDLFEIKDTLGNPTHEVRRLRENVDFTENRGDVIP